MNLPKKFKSILRDLRAEMAESGTSNFMVVERPTEDAPPTFMLLLSSNPSDIDSIETYYEMMADASASEGGK